MQFISPIDWNEAVDKIGARTPIGSALNSEQWARLPLALRERAFFSSQIESVRFLQAMRDGITEFLSSAKEPTSSGEMALATGSRQQFVKDFSELAISMGLGPLDAADAGTLKDITSEGRLGLIFDVQTQAANDYSFWKQGMEPDVLDAFPAQRFIREREVKAPRPVHQQNEGVVRLKSDLGFWMAMNDPTFGGFGVPWGPWGFNSGMGVDDVDRGESESLGLISPKERPQPVVQDFNDRLEASARGLDDDMLAQLKSSFGDQVEFDGDTVKWANLDADTTPAPAVITAPEPQSEADAAATLNAILQKLELDGDQPATAADMRSLVDELKEAKPATPESVIHYIHGAQPGGALSDANISGVVGEFISFFPREKLAHLPPLKIQVKPKLEGDYGIYHGKGLVSLNAKELQNHPDQARQTMFHEFMHWIHREGPEEYRSAIRDHFKERTAGEEIKKLPEYGKALGKTDKWYEAYAGRIYNMFGGDEGIEVPTRYMEWLTFTPEEMAKLWNQPDFRETMKIVLEAMF